MNRCRSLRSRAILGLCLAGLSGTPAGRAEPSNTAEPDAPLPPAQEVLAKVRAAFPADPLRIAGQLLVRDRKGDVQRTINAEMLLEWGATPPQARFVVRDAFGGLLGQLVIRRPADAAPAYELSAGDPPRPLPAPDLNAAVAESDFSWSDLSLAFLWWPGGTTEQLEMKLNRECYVVEIPAPGDAGGDTARMRLWIDAKMYALFQADAYDAKGSLKKRLKVEALQKLDNGEWTIKDFEVQSRPARTRTTLTISSIGRVGAPAALPAEAPPAVAPVPPPPAPALGP